MDTSLLLWGKTTPVSAGASDYGSEGWGFESLRACHLFDDWNVRTDTGELSNPSDGCLRGELQGRTGDVGSDHLRTINL